MVSLNESTNIEVSKIIFRNERFGDGVARYPEL